MFTNSIRDSPFRETQAALMVQAATDCGTLCQNIPGCNACKDELAFALSVGVISLVFCIAFAVLERYNMPMAQKVAIPLSLFLFLLWCVGACVFTFDKPFPATGNGYFASWGGEFDFLSLFAIHSSVQVQRRRSPLPTSRVHK